MTAQEQAFEVAWKYINGSRKERETILSCFSEKERDIFLRGVGVIHLFSDKNFYENTMEAMREQIVKELYGDAS